jgi:hypothetical protein
MQNKVCLRSMEAVYVGTGVMVPWPSAREVLCAKVILSPNTCRKHATLWRGCARAEKRA